MKIMILGSMTFAKEMLQVEAQLQQLGFEGVAPFDAAGVKLSKERH